MEYFAACRLARLLIQAAPVDCLPTDTIVEFVFHLVSESHRYEARIEDDMALIPAGPFIYGASRLGNLSIVTVEHSFWIDRLLVTNAQFCEFLNAHGAHEDWIDLAAGSISLDSQRAVYKPASGCADHPVAWVTQAGAAAYAECAGKRLPTEHEWEKAARDIDGRKYPWGEAFSIDRCNTNESGGFSATTAVGAYGKPGESPFGCADMAGNVWEWISSPYSDATDSAVIKGGSWKMPASSAECSRRGFELWGDHSLAIGFRCARDGTI